MKTRFYTRGDWQNGVHFIFASLERELTGEEFEMLCERYLKKHQEITLSKQALFVDLSPAFEIPLADVTPKTFLGVPQGYTPPSP
jgi:hypothetical protein